jgi:DNA-binding NtrC family response regulator
MPSALLVDDDAPSLSALGELIKREGFEVRTAESCEKARAELAGTHFDIVLCDLQLPDGSGLDLLGAVDPVDSAEFVFITGYGSIDSAVEAFRGGAVDYLTKPIDVRRLKKILANVTHATELREEVESLRDELRSLGHFGRMMGGSSAMQQVYDMILRVAPTEATVLVTGETGTGKELVAETVHGLSRRAKKPFVAVNCGALAPTLIESEFFGHERGSFTGAERKHRGVFERANGGTLFLDEITEMPLELQVRLLRVLESGIVTRVGGDQTVKVDVRIVAATNRNLKEGVAEGKLREDLLYRLLVFPIHLPALREREGDVPLLANHFLEQLNRSSGSSKQFSQAALAKLQQHAWPGNVRELKHIVERAFIMARSDVVEAEAVPLAEGTQTPPATPLGERIVPMEIGASIAEMERQLILATLEHCEGNKNRAAQTLGISLKTLYNRLNIYNAGSRQSLPSKDAVQAGSNDPSGTNGSSGD